MDALTKAWQAGDLVALVDTLAEDVTLRVAVHDAPFQGRGAAAHILGAVLDGVLHHIEIGETITGPDTTVLTFRVSVARHPGRADGLLLLRADDAGRVDDVTVFLRPLAALQALADEMGRRLGGPRP